MKQYKVWIEIEEMDNKNGEAYRTVDCDSLSEWTTYEEALEIFKRYV